MINVHRTRHVTSASGNVFLDLGFPPREAARLLKAVDAAIDGVFAAGERGADPLRRGPPGYVPQMWWRCSSGCASGCCAGSRAQAPSTRTTRSSWRAGTTARASRWMPRCASKTATGPGRNGCCGCGARPPFALERLQQADAAQLLYRLLRPHSDGRTEL